MVGGVWIEALLYFFVNFIVGLHTLMKKTTLSPILPIRSLSTYALDS